MIQIDSRLSLKFANMSIVAAVMVVFLHMGGNPAVGTLNWWPYVIIRQICKMAVPFFFLASGFFLVGHADQPNWYLDALRKRVRTLVVPYFIWSALWIAYFVPICCRHGGWSDFVRVHFWSFFGLDLMLPPFYSVTWYLRALIFMILLSPLLIWLVRRFRWVFVLSLWIADVVFRILSHDPSGFVFPFFHYAFPLEYFVLGIGLRLGVLKSLRLPSVFHLMFLVMCFLVVNRFVYVHRILPTLALEGLLIPLLMVLVWSFSPATSWPRMFTNASFRLYMIHSFALAILTSLVFGVTNNVFLLVLKTMFAILLSFATIYVLRKTSPQLAGLMLGGR